MKQLRSSGGVVVYKIHGVWNVLIIKDMNNSWTFPKGNIEKGETIQEAAIREIAEETGLKYLHRIHTLPTVQYTYKRNGKILKKVYYHLFTLQRIQKIYNQKEEGIKEAKFMPFNDALSCIGYTKTNIPLLKKSYSYLCTL